MAEGTLFSAVYNRFLSKITDDLYMELTPEDTLRDMQNLLLDAIPGFEFPRVNLYDYTISTEEVSEEDIGSDDFIIGSIIWHNIEESELEGSDEESTSTPAHIVVDRSYFTATLTAEEQNILALLMKQSWVERQVASIENTRMKYSGSDFAFTSQAAHLNKLLSLLEEARRDSFHMQRLYKRRKTDTDGTYASNWSVLRDISVIK